jgi:hypothetical protein
MLLSQIPLLRRRDIFRRLVEAQNAGASVPEARRAVAQSFDLNEIQVRCIEEMGLRSQWPPFRAPKTETTEG